MLLYCEGQTYIACDWDSDVKEKCYDISKADVSIKARLIIIITILCPVSLGTFLLRITFECYLNGTFIHH
jgi:hypothetical protein